MKKLKASKLHTIPILAVLLLSGFLFALPAVLPAHAVTCTTVTPTDTKFGSSVTAAVIATSGSTISGTVDATGCDVGVYAGPGITGVTVTAGISNANQAGVFNDGGSVTVTATTVSNTGNHVGGTFSPNGVQTGIGIYFSCTGAGSISTSTVNEYQKGGITVRSLSGVSITDNTVTGLGPVKFIAQNGIEAGFGSCGPAVSNSNVGSIAGNTVSGDIYTQGGTAGGTPYVSTGILVQALSGSSTGQLTSALHVSNSVFRNQADITVIVG